MIEKAFFQRDKTDKECWLTVLQGNFNLTRREALAIYNVVLGLSAVSADDVIPFEGEPAPFEPYEENKGL